MSGCQTSRLPPTCCGLIAHVAHDPLQVLSPECERASLGGRSLKAGDEIGRLLDIERILHID